MRHFVLDFPYSNVGPSQLMPGENAECACQALRDIFEWLGGVPPRIVSGQRRGRGAQDVRAGEADAPVPVVPGALRVRIRVLQRVRGPREGRRGVPGRRGAPQAVRAGAERAGACRRSTPGCLNGASRWATRTTTAREVARRTCPRGDRKALLALPETRFDVAAWKRMKADKYGIVTVEGRHRYAAGPEHAGREPVVGLRAFEVRAARCLRGPHHDASARLRRQPHQQQATRPCGSGCRGDRPGAWPNSQVREALADPLREWLDGQARAVLAEGLRTLRQAERESGWANAVAAMAEILETTGGIDRAGVCLAAARHAAGTEPVAYDEPVDPTRIRPGVRREGGQRMSQRNEERTDIDRLRARARALFISQATIDDLLAWATPRQLQAVDRLLHTEPGQPRDLEARQAPAPRPVPRPQDAGRPRSSRT